MSSIKTHKKLFWNTKSTTATTLLLFLVILSPPSAEAKFCYTISDMLDVTEGSSLHQLKGFNDDFVDLSAKTTATGASPPHLGAGFTYLQGKLIVEDIKLKAARGNTDGLGELIGVGGQGSVYSYDVALSRTSTFSPPIVKNFALKRISYEKSSVNDIKNLINELKAFHALKDTPNFVSLYACFIDHTNKLIYLLMPRLAFHIAETNPISSKYPESGSPRDMVINLDDDARCNLITQISTVVDEFHKNGWVHRDLKPENFVGTDVEFHGVNLIDCGFCIKMTEKRQPPATIIYWAPESVVLRCQNEDISDKELCDNFKDEIAGGTSETEDNWALGITAAEVLVDIVIYIGVDPNNFTDDDIPFIVELEKSYFKRMPLGTVVSDYPKTNPIELAKDKIKFTDEDFVHFQFASQIPWVYKDSISGDKKGSAPVIKSKENHCEINYNKKVFNFGKKVVDKAKCGLITKLTSVAYQLTRGKQIEKRKRLEFILKKKATFFTPTGNNKKLLRANTVITRTESFDHNSIYEENRLLAPKGERQTNPNLKNKDAAALLNPKLDSSKMEIEPRAEAINQKKTHLGFNGKIVTQMIEYAPMNAFRGIYALYISSSTHYYPTALQVTSVLTLLMLHRQPTKRALPRELIAYSEFDICTKEEVHKFIFGESNTKAAIKGDIFKSCVANFNKRAKLPKAFESLSELMAAYGPEGLKPRLHEFLKSHKGDKPLYHFMVEEMWRPTLPIGTTLII